MKKLTFAILSFVAGIGCDVRTGFFVDSEPTSEVAQSAIFCVEAADCPWEWKDCYEAVCISGVCAVEARITGTQCTSGVGICTVDKECKPPVGKCKAQDAPFVCGTSSDCVDTNACTWGECVVGRCHYTSDVDGGPCTEPGNVCNWGASCSMPTGLCELPWVEPLPPGVSQCTTRAQCDDHDTCTWDSCELGTCQHSPHRDGTYCTTHRGTDGQCLSGMCCLP